MDSRLTASAELSGRDLHARAEQATQQSRLLVAQSRALASAMFVSVERLSRVTRELGRALQDLGVPSREDRALTLAASVAHELRTPLFGIQGWVRILQETPDPEIRERAVRSIESSAQKQERLIADLLDAARARSGQLSLELSTFDVAEVVQATADALQTMLKGRELLCELEPNLHVRGDAFRIQQVVDNLLRNAIKFTHEDGRIEVSVRARSADQVAIAVHDDGMGIDPAFLPHVFASYRQARHSEVRRGGGIGLGLTISKQIVQLHGGTIEARSGGVGQGSQFEVALPRGGSV